MNKEAPHNHNIELFKEQKDGFCEHMKIINQSPNTIANYHYGLKLFFGYLWKRGIDDLREVTKEIIKDYQHYLSQYKCEDGHSYTLSTIHVMLRSLKRFFEYLEKTNQILYNPGRSIIMPKLGDRLPRDILTQEEMRQILAAPNTSTLAGIRDKTILELFYSTGIRLEELSNLTIYDLDYRNGFLRVNKGKFAKDRILPLGRKACDYLREYINKVRPVLTKENKEERALFIGVNSHRKMNIQTIEHMVRGYARLAGIKKKVTPHTFRHTCATHLLAGGAGILHVQKLLGHAHTQTTQVYTRVRPLDVKKAQAQYHPREKGKRERVIKPKEGKLWILENYNRIKRKREKN